VASIAFFLIVGGGLMLFREGFTLGGAWKAGAMGCLGFYLPSLILGHLKNSASRRSS
jgi:hypothetical protein